MKVQNNIKDLTEMNDVINVNFHTLSTIWIQYIIISRVREKNFTSSKCSHFYFFYFFTLNNILHNITKFKMS